MSVYPGDSLFILRHLIARDFKVRYRNMSLGVLWSLVNPLVMMGLLTFVFSVVFKNPREHFPLFVLMGIVPYNFFTLAWASGTNSVVDNGSLVKKVPFRRELLPISVVLANSLHYFIQIGLLLILVGVVIGPRISWLLLPVVIVLQLVFVCGLTLLTSALDVYFRDMRYIVESANLMLFWLVPIFYGFDDIPKQYTWLVELNPLAAVVLLTRTILLRGVLPEPITMAKLGIGAILTLTVGWFVFGRMKRNFADYV